MKDRDLENFARYFTTTLHTGMGHVDAYYKRKNDIVIAEAKRAQEAANLARQNRKDDQWIAQSKAYMDYLNKRGAAIGAKGGGRGGGGANTGSVFDNVMATDGIDTGVAPPATPVVYQVNTPEPLVPAPGEPPSTLSRGGRVPRFMDGGMMDLETAMRGGPGGKKQAAPAAAAGGGSGGESALGGAIGRWMAKQNQPPGSGETYARGGSVGAIQTAPPRQRFADGGGVYRQGPQPLPPYQPNYPRDPRETEAELLREQARNRLLREGRIPDTSGNLDPRISGLTYGPYRDTGRPGPSELTQRQQDRAFDEQSRNTTSSPGANRAGGVEPPPGQHVVDSIERQRINEYWRANTPSNPSGEQRTHGTMVGPGGTADVDPGAHRDWDPRAKPEPFQHHPDDTHPPMSPAPGEPETPRNMPEVTVTASRVDGRRGTVSRSGPEPWKKLGDQTRTAAYHYEKDYGDERNMRAVDRWGRSRQTGPAPAAQPGPQRAVDLSGGPMGGHGREPQGSNGPRAGLSTNNAANDYEAAQGAANYAEHMFHLNKADPNSAKGYEALAKGHGAPSIQTIHAMRQSIDPEGKLPPNEMMRQLRNKTYEFYMAQGDKAKADKTAFEVSQFGNVMAKSHGANAKKALAKGDMATAINEIAAGYNWLPNGHTVNVDPSGKTVVIEGPDGQIVQQIPITPEILKQASDGMAHGVFNWDVMNGGGPLPSPGLNGPQLGPQPDRGGGGGGGGQAISPTVPPPVSQGPPPKTTPAGAQPPPAATAGPPAPPPAATPSSPAAAPTSGAPGAPPGSPPAAPPVAVAPAVPPTLAPPRPPLQLPPRPAPGVPSVVPGSAPQVKPPAQAQTPPAPPAAAAPAPTPPAPTPVIEKTVPTAGQSGRLPVQSHADAQRAAGAPADPAKPPATSASTTAASTTKEPTVAERRAAIRPKEQTDEERHAALEEKYKKNPDYVPTSAEMPPIRRGSRDVQPVHPQEWRHRAQEAEFDLEQKLKLVAAAREANIKQTGKAPPAASVARAVKHYNDIYKRRIDEIKAEKKEHDDAQAKLDSQESARIDNRKIASAAPDTTVHKVINAEVKKVADKYLKVTDHEKEAAKGKKADKDWAAARNSPIRYMGTEESRARLGDVARQIWQANGMPDMSEKKAVDLAILATSFVSDKAEPDMNGHKGEKGRTYRKIGYDTLGNVVIQTKGGDVAHIPKQTMSDIENLRKANLNEFKDAEKERNDPRNKVPTTSEIIKGGVKQVVKGLAKSPLLPNAGIVPKDE